MATLTRTARQLIEGALRALGVYGQNQDFDNEDMDDGLRFLEEVLAGLSSEVTITPETTQNNFTLAIGTPNYTIGSGATVSVDRPKAITGGFIRDSGSNDYPITPMTREEYNAIYDKDAAARPDRFYYDDTYANGTIYFNSAPAAAETCFMDMEMPIGTIATLDTTVAIPPEFMKYVKFELASVMGPEYDVGAGKMREMLTLSKAQKDMLKRLKVETHVTDFEDGLMEAMV